MNMDEKLVGQYISAIIQRGQVIYVQKGVLKEVKDDSFILDGGRLDAYSNKPGGFCSDNHLLREDSCDKERREVDSTGLVSVSGLKI